MEVNGDRTAHRRAHLVHQAAGLAEVDVFRVLADLGDFDRVERTAAAEVVEDVADQHLVSSGGGQAGTGQHVRGHIGIKAAQRMPQFGDLGGDAAHQRRRGVFLILAGGQAVQRDLEGGISLGVDADDVQPVGCGAGQHIQIHAAAQHMAVLVVGVVAADLSAARAGEQRGRSIGRGREFFDEARNNVDRAGAGLVQALAGAVQRVQSGQNRIVLAIGQGLQKLCGSVHSCHLIL